MAKRVKFKANNAGMREVRERAAVMAELNSHADRIAATAGPGFTASPAEFTGGRGRGRASVYTETFEAMLRQARDHVLEKAIGGVGMVEYTSKTGKKSYVTQKQHDNYSKGRKS